VAFFLEFRNEFGFSADICKLGEFGGVGYGRFGIITYSGILVQVCCSVFVIV
jgi:hypothetical protein